MLISILIFKIKSKIIRFIIDGKIEMIYIGHAGSICIMSVFTD